MMENQGLEFIRADDYLIVVMATENENDPYEECGQIRYCPEDRRWWFAHSDPCGNDWCHCADDLTVIANYMHELDARVEA